MFVLRHAESYNLVSFPADCHKLDGLPPSTKQGRVVTPSPPPPLDSSRSMTSCRSARTTAASPSSPEAFPYGMPLNILPPPPSRSNFRRCLLQDAVSAASRRAATAAVGVRRLGAAAAVQEDSAPLYPDAVLTAPETNQAKVRSSAYGFLAVDPDSRCFWRVFETKRYSFARVPSTIQSLTCWRFW